MLRSHVKHDDSPVRILPHEGILGVGRIRGDEDGGVRNRRENRAQHELLDVAIVQKVARLLEVRLPISLADVKAHDRSLPITSKRLLTAISISLLITSFLLTIVDINSNPTAE